MSLGALTTTFTPPASCRASLTGPPIYDGRYYQGPVFTSDCFPPNYSFSRSPDNYYSPAIACPVGYSTGCMNINVQGTVTETAVICCPPSLTCNPNMLLWEQTLGCNSRFRATIFPTVHYMSGSVVTSTGATTETGTFDGALNAYSVQIRFQATDLPTTTSETD
ncbi:hypothetical protein MMYC01_201424 [Madurella mycetomatis]|uniref:Uncharacterized protein n=1 Tax=Madurella mycetomatis TaxID=100816 RepID=A0A175WC49_9PEZI|nr:hypothetical protein MMYC01_203478 [Madurella mycetomatis]KXX81348.1 hypothetical protein MMYC01_201424 [Madurella mycetomatis]